MISGIKWDEKIMKIKKQIYKVVCRGKRFLFPLYVNESVAIREKVLIRKNIPSSLSNFNPKS
jgi:tricorn protease-like protein